MKNFDGSSSLMASIWLVVLVVPAVVLVALEGATVRTVGGIALLALFSGVYAVAFGMIDQWPHTLTMPRRYLFWFGLLALVAVATAVVIGSLAAFLVPFFVAMLAFPLPLTVSLPAMTALVLGSTGLIYLTEPDAMPGALGGTLVSPLMVYAVALVTRRYEEKAHLEHELAIARERESIAVDVHDLLGHSLTVVTLKSELAGRLVDTDPAAAKNELEQITRLSRTALAEVRSTVTRMRSPDLAGEVEAARRALTTAGIEAVLSQEVSVAGVNAHLYSWVVREGVTNVVRHSRARRCEVTMTADRVEVIDDGVGCDGAWGNGLTGLGRRVGDAGGTLTVTVGLGGQGTRLSVSMTGGPR
ncbi:Two-component system, sensory histidine kinase [Corynebacterium glyciniphilum AJ 3170]|uniref:Two-component system, sensory histidine kinase n=1 Tax=Corynebacterium glyciniphilum AJ 3170 TaxID=1404245 RepID=X5DMH5_9CORY|nr:sensor histidine kinase [Corynebacterium glyciniphilum]AHW62504.1 Two-component system, sensory histidine kinase [Corynebacterium glyciniphilum AJ 3170]